MERSKVSPRQIAVFSFLILFVLGRLIVAGGSDPDAEFSSIRFAGVSFVFFAWAMSLAGWGRLLTSALKFDGTTWVNLTAFGLVFYAALAIGLGHRGLIGPNFSPVFLILVCAGIFLWWKPGVEPKLFPRFKPEEIFAAGLYLLIGVIVLLRLIKAQNLFGSSDPLFYQLLGPRLWTDAGHVYLPKGAPLVFLGSYWEYLHIWAFRLLSSEPGYGLIESQIFAQMTHVVFGYLATGIAIDHLCRRFFGVNRTISLFATLCALSIRDFVWVTVTAKNDLGVSFFILAAMCQLGSALRGENWKLPRESKYYAAAGLFLGFATGAKFTNVLISGVLALTVLWVGYRKKNPNHLRSIIILGVFGLIGLLPYLIRNYLVTGNPTFPYYVSLFSSKLTISPGLLENLKFYEEGVRPNILQVFEWMGSIFRQEPTLILSPLVLIYAVLSRVKQGKFPNWFPFFSVWLLSMIFFVCVGTRTEIRHFGVILVIGAATTALGVSEILESLGRFKVVVYGFLIGALFLLSNDLFLEGNYKEASLIRSAQVTFSQKNPPLQIRENHEGGAVKAWLRMHAPNGTRVVAVNDVQFYYMPRMEVSSFEMSPEFSQMIVEGWDPKKILMSFSDPLGYDYMIETMHSGTRTGFAKELDGYFQKNPCLVILQTQNARLVDLRKISTIDLEGCPKNPS